MIRPTNPAFETVVRQSFAAQHLMSTIGAELVRVAAGEVEIHLPFRTDLTQQHGFLHAGVTTAVMDSCCGYAALSLMPPGAGVLTVEFKMNLLAPARGDVLIARGKVARAGRTITVCTADAVMLTAGAETAVATMLSTMMTIEHRPGITG